MPTRALHRLAAVADAGVIEPEPLLLRLHRAQGIGELWTALQAVLREAVPYDALVVYLNFLDFAHSWRAAKILATPNARRPTPWYEARRRVDMTPQFVLSQPPGLKAYRLSDVIRDPQELRRTPFFRNYFAPGGWHHVAVQLFWRGHAVRSQIAIRRTRAQGDFTPHELSVLEELHPHVETVINRILTLEEEQARRCWLENFNQHLPFALLSLDWALEPVFANNDAFEQCAAWNYGRKDARRYQARAVFQTPAPIEAACARLKSEWLERRAARDASAEDKVTLSVAHPLDTELTATITIQNESRCPAANPGFLIHLQMQDPGRAQSTARLEMHSMLECLTHAERELARYVCRGFGNQEIADQLNKSVRTVKGQLTSVYRKLGVSSRSRLLAAFTPLLAAPR